MVDFKNFKQKALLNKEVKKEYYELKQVFEIKKKLIKARIDKGLTQEEVAKRMNTSKSNISRLESLNNSYTPNLSTLIRYANVLDCKLKVELN